MGGLALAAGLGCSSQPPLVSVPEPLPSAPPPAASPVAAPWELPEDAISTQRLFRVRFESEEGDGRFRLTLRLLDRERFQLRAIDPLGRSVWTLHSDRGESLFLDHRDRRACRFGPRVDLTELYLGSFPARDLPALILGRVPAVPEGALLWTGGGAAGLRTLDFLDRQDRAWACRLMGERLEGWSLTSPDGRLLASLHREERGFRLEDRRRRLEVRWREVGAEPLRRGLQEPEIPPSYRRESCFAGAPEP